MANKNSTPIPDVSKLIIDTDAGVDDAGALMMALTQNHKEILAICIVNGNCSVKQGVANVSRVQKGLKTKVPVFCGAWEPLIANPDRHVPSHYHGFDGFGDVPHAHPQQTDNDFDNYIKHEHAALAMIRLVKENRGSTALVCLGPLTNLALAIKLDRQFCDSLAAVFLMGGNCFGVGNVCAGSTSEFNFQGDPEAAHIVLKEMNCPIVIAPWELYSNIFTQNAVSRPLDRHLHMDTDISKFLAAISGVGQVWLAERKLPYSFCDEMAMAAALDKRVVNKCLIKHGSVELQGKYTRGQIAVDWMNDDDNSAKLIFIQEIDADRVEDMMIEAVNYHNHKVTP